MVLMWTNKCMLWNHWLPVMYRIASNNYIVYGTVLYCTGQSISLRIVLVTVQFTVVYLDQCWFWQYNRHRCFLYRRVVWGWERMELSRVRRRRGRANVIILALSRMALKTAVGVTEPMFEVKGATEENIGWQRKTEGARYIQSGLSPWVYSYLGSHPRYPGSEFRRYFRVPRPLFLKIGE